MLKQILERIEQSCIGLFILNIIVYLFTLLLDKKLIAHAFALLKDDSPVKKIRILYFLAKFKFSGLLDHWDPNFRLVLQHRPLSSDVLLHVQGIIQLLETQGVHTVYQQICIADLKYLAHQIEEDAFREVFQRDILPLKQKIPKNYVPRKEKNRFVKRLTFSKEDAREALKLVYQVLAFHGIKSFLMSGTLLGAIREGDFLAHDYDIDLGVFDKDITVGQLNKIFEREQAFSIENMDEPYLLKVKYKNRVPIDIFVHFEEGNTYWHGASYHRWDNEKFELVEKECLGGRYNIPQDADKYLTENYGNWRTPQINFDCFYDTPNVKQQATHEGIVFLLKQCWYSYHNNQYDRFIHFINRLDGIFKQKND